MASHSRLGTEGVESASAMVKEHSSMMVHWSTLLYLLLLCCRIPSRNIMHVLLKHVSPGCGMDSWHWLT